LSPGTAVLDSGKKHRGLLIFLKGNSFLLFVLILKEIYQSSARRENAMNALVCRVLAVIFCLIPLTVMAAKSPEVKQKKVEAVLPQLTKLAEQTLKQTGVPGMAIVVVYKDKVVYLKGFGVRQAGTDTPITADTVFQLASVSKPMTSTVLAALVGEGVINWNDPVIKHFPDFRLYVPWVTEQVTLRDMLCHRSGLPEQAGDKLEDMGYTQEEILNRLRYLKPASSFRSHFAYTNFGFTVAAVAAAKAAGKSWEELVTEKLYKPLGMKSSSSRFKDFEAAKNRAYLHVRVDYKWVVKNVRNPQAQSPAGGVSSTPRDLAKWMRLQLADGKFQGRQIINAQALAETHRPQIVSGFNPKTNRASFYGLGWNVDYDDQGRVFWKHSGAFFLGMRTEVALLPAEDIGIAVLSNAAPTGIPEGMTQSFFELLLKGELTKDWITLGNQMFEEMVKNSYCYNTDYSKPPTPVSPALPAEAYVGTYQNPYFGNIEIAAKDGALVLRLGPKKTAFDLLHYDRDVFIYQPVGESAGGLSGVTFWVGPDLQATKVVIEYLNTDGQGTFSRKTAKK
jgi:CubicO group peptidase (beta-lactamase class C family)